MQIYESVKGLKKWQKTKGLMSLLGLFSFALILNTPAQASEFRPVLDRIKTASESYLSLGAGNHTIYTSLSTTKGANYPDVVVLNGTIYYFKADESTPELTTAIRNLAATGANAVREVTSSDDYIFSVGGKYYTYFASQLPSSAWQASAGSPNDYNFAHKNGDTISYYNFGLKNNTPFTWTKSGTEEADPVWDETNQEATGTIKIVMPHTTVSDTTPTTAKETTYYTYTYKLPTGYTKTTIRATSDTMVNNRFFMGIKESQQGGAMYFKNKNIDTIRADFIGNSTTDSYGSGAVAFSGNGNLNYLIGNFIDNKALAENGGGASLGTSGKIGAIIGNFIANISVNKGGALYRQLGPTGSIVGSFISNSAKYGGAFFQNSANIGAIAGDFIANSSTAEGGAIYTGGAAATAIYSLVGNFINNSAGTLGGAIYVHNAISDITITGDFTGNTAGSTDGGGAIYNKGKVTLNATDRDISFYNNKAASAYNDIYNTSSLTLNAYTDRYIDFSGSVKGSNGTIYINNDSVINGGNYIFNNEVSGNTVKIYRGANVKLGSATQTDSTTTYGVLNLTGFTNDANGGSIDMANNHVNSTNFGAMTLGSDLNLSIDAALAEATRGADYLAASSITANGHYLIINSINVISDAASSPISVAIANNTLRDYVKLTTDEMRVQGVDESVSYVVTYDKTSGTEGLLTFVAKEYLLPDAVADTKAERNYHMGGDEEMEADLGQMGGGTGASLTVNAGYGEDAHTVQGNQHGGIIVGDGQTLTIHGGMWKGFENSIGGAIYNNGGHLSITSSHFISNKVMGTGGAIQNTGNNASITDSYFVSNKGISNGYGGAIYNTGNHINITSSEFYNNKNALGGAIDNTGSYMNITSSTFVSNKATNYAGGAISNSGDDTTITDSAFISNTTYYSGGAIDNSGSNAEIKDSTFVSNSADSLGGAINNSGSNISITSSTFVSNSAGTNGGAIYNTGTGATITDSTFVSNSANSQGSAIYNYTSGTITLNADTKDIIFSGNKANGKPNDIFNSNGTITIAGTHAVNMDGGIQSYGDDAALTINSGSTLNLNIGQGTIQNGTFANSLGKLTSNGNFNATIDMNLASGDVDTISSLAGSTGTITLTSLNILGSTDWDDINTDTTFQILQNATDNNNVTLALSSALAAELATHSHETHTPIPSYDDQIGDTTYWNDILYHHDFSDFVSTKTVGLVTKDTTNDSLGVRISSSGGVETKTALTGDLLKKVVQATTPETRSFLADDATNSYNVTEDLGQMGGTTLTINGRNTADTNLTINGNEHGGIIVGDGQTLTINGGVWDNFKNAYEYENADMYDAGGAIFNSNGTLNINSATFSSNHAGSGSYYYGQGGAISNKGAMSISSSIFVSNYVNDDGGAIDNNGNDISIANSIFVSNSAGDTGGAISNGGGNMHITDSIFVSNSAGWSGAIFNYSSGAYMSIASSTFVANNSASDNGGAVHNNGAYMSIANSIFVSNTATNSYNGDGGALANEGGNYASITDSTFVSNISNYGGAIDNSGSNAEIKDSTFVSNSANGNGGAIWNNGAYMSVADSTFVSNSAQYGGAIYNTGTGATITDSTFVSNSANSQGGAIYNKYSSTSATGTLTLNADTKDIIFTGNKANGKPNDIFNSNGAITIAGSHAVNMDGGIQSFGDNATLTINSGSTLNLNIGQGTIQNGTLANSLGKLTSNGNFNATIDMNLASGDVDTISSLAGSTGTITLTSLNILGSTDWDDINTDTTFQILKNATGNNNVTLALSSALAAELATHSHETHTPIPSYDDQIGDTTYWNDILYHHDFSDFVSTKTVGLVTKDTTNDSLGVRISSSGGVETKTALTGDLLKKVVQATTPAERNFLAGDATNAYEVTEDLGQMGGTTLTINGRNTADTDLTIKGNQHGGIIVGSGQALNINNVTLDGFKNATGGAINNNGTLIIASSKFIDNEASNPGGAIFNQGYGTQIANSDFVSNSANYYGGAIYNQGGAYMSISSSTFVSNTENHGYGGGAVYNGGAYMNITNSIFVSNSAGSGGAIHNYVNYMSVANSDFVSNSGGTTSGAIYNSGAHTDIASSNFVSNSGNNGGAIYNSGTHTSIASSNFVSNSAGHGGAIWNHGSNTSITSSIFVSNSADDRGGAIYNSGANVKIEDTSFVLNSSNYGGAVYNTGTNLSIASSQFASNKAIYYYGGAIYNSGTNATITDSTFAFNSASEYNAKGGAIYNTGAYMSIANSDFISNSADASGGAIYNHTSGTITLNADQKDAVFSGNTANGKPNDIFNSNGAITIAGSHAVNMDGGIQSFGDNATLTINSGSTLNLNIGQGTIQNGTLANSLGKLTSNGNFNATIDMNLASGDVDTISSLAGSTGTITLTSLNILGGNWIDVDETTKFQILKNATGNNNLQLDLVDSLKEKTVIGTTDEHTEVEAIVTDTSWDKIYKTTTTTASTTYGQIILATKDTTNDSLAYLKTTEGGEVIVTSQGNTLALVNSSTLTTRNFNANEDGATYTLDDDVDLGTTTAGTFNINGIADGDEETLDLNGVDSFKLANETTLNFNNVTVTSSDNIADVTNSSATIGLDSATVDGNITADVAYNLVTRGSSVLKGTVEKANLTIDSGELTTTAENIADANSVTNNATLNLSGGLAQIINGTSGTTKVNSSLGLNSGAEIKGTLDINDGEITVSDGEITSHNIGAITGNGFMTIDVNLTNQTADKLTIANNSDASITLNPVNIIDDVDELDKNFNVKVLDTTSDAKLVATDDTFSDKEYLIDTVNGKTVEDEINAVTKWNEEYQKHITADEFIYGKLGLDDTNTSIKVSESSRSGGGTTDVTMGDTLALVTKDETNPTKIFIANNDGDNYDLEGGLSELKGNLTISGIEGNEEEVIDLNNHNGFEINDSNASLTLKDVTLTNANGNVVANSAGTLTGTNTKINGNISNQSSAKFTDSKVNGNIENEGNIDLTDTDINGAIVNDGTLEVNKNVKLGTVIGSGTTNINADIDLINSINGNTVNVKNATLTGAQKLGTDVTLNTFGSTLELGTNTVNVKSLTLDENSKLTLRINGFAEGQYGQLNALENITIVKGAKLAATITQGIGTGDITLLKAPTHTGDFDDADVTHTEEGIEIADNNMYKFEKKAGQFGVFTISKKATAEELVLKDGGEKWVAKAAGAWVDGPEFKDNTPARDVADKLAYLTQHDIKGLQRNLKALAPTENTIVQINSTEEASRLFRTVDGHLRGTRYPLGISSGDTPQGVSIWAKAYVGEAKIDTRGRTAGSNADSRGLIMGIEKKLDKTKKIGAGFHYDSTDVDALSRNIEVDSTAGFIYAEYKPTRWFINGIASYGQSNYHEKKHALDTTYDATYDVHMASLAAMTGYQFKHVTPEAGLRYYHIKQDGYTDSAEQTVKSSNTDILRAVAGVRFARGICNVRPEIYAGLTYDVMTDRNNTMVNLTNGTTYTVPGRRLPRLGYETEVGASIILRDGLIASVSYQGAYRKDYQEHSGMVNLKYEF